MKKCPKCQANAEDTAKFCIKCGYKFTDNSENEQICPNCKTKFTCETFCPECGYDITSVQKREAECEVKAVHEAEAEHKTRNAENSNDGDEYVYDASCYLGCIEYAIKNVLLDDAMYDEKLYKSLLKEFKLEKKFKLAQKWRNKSDHDTYEAYLLDGGKGDRKCNKYKKYKKYDDNYLKKLLFEFWS